jgi:CRP-like cAMP-binding protein
MPEACHAAWPGRAEPRRRDNEGVDGGPEALSERLRRFPLLADADEELVDWLATACDRARFEPGQWIVQPGSRSGGLYFVLEGEAAAVGDGRDPDLLHPGSFFGEVSVLLDEPASAGVVARTELVCLTVPAGAVERALLDRRGLALALLRVEARRLQTATQWRV